MEGAYRNSVSGNAFVKRAVTVAIAVLPNDILNRTIGCKTDELIDDLNEKIKTLWVKLRAIPEKLKRRFSRYPAEKIDPCGIKPKI